MLYIVFFLLLLAGWQGIMKGRKSKEISGASLWLALIIVIIGLILRKIEISGVLFILFILINIFVFMQIYRISFFPKNFSKIIPVFLVFGALIGYLLFLFNFSKYFTWYVILTVGFVMINYRKQQQDSALALIMNAKDEEQKKQLKKFSINTLRFHLLSSLLYIIAVIISFLYFYNT